MTMAVDPEPNATFDIKLAKEAFKRLLIEHKGDATQAEAKEALDKLVKLADRGAEWSPAESMDINQGRWRSVTTPPFRGKLPDDPDGRRCFTLGCMSFGMFKPTKMVCAVDDIVNTVEALPVDENEGESDENEQKKEEGAPAWTQTYNVQCLIDIETPDGTKLPATLTTYGVCFPKTPTRLGVKFTSGDLLPNFDLSSFSNASLVASWKETFDNAVGKEAETQSYLAQLGTYVSNKMMSLMMGLEPPVDKSDFTQTFAIKKPFVGHLDIVYLDEDFRVTQGNRGTIVVVERLANDETKD